MIRTYRYPLKATRRQLAVLDEWRVRCAELYNAALEQRRTAWRMSRTSVTRYDQTADLTALRAAMPEWAAMPALVARSALTRLDRAFQAFFRRVKAGDKPGYPRFRSARRYDSFGLGHVRVEPGRVRVPLLGWVRFNCYRPLDGAVRNVEIKRTAKRWWVCVACDIGAAPPKRVVRTATGLDLGLTHFATLADGATVANPRHFAVGQRRLARRQRALARATRGSRNRIKTRHRIALAHEHIANQRRDFHRKVAADLCARYDLIAHEALNVKGLASGMLAKSVNDVGWGQFLATLALKAENAGVHVVAVDPSGTSQNCSSCGTVVRKSLAERIHRCEACGLVMDRDENAARNILTRARGRRAAACGGDVSRLDFGRAAAPMKQEVPLGISDAQRN